MDRIEQSSIDDRGAPASSDLVGKNTTSSKRNAPIRYNASTNQLSPQPRLALTNLISTSTKRKLNVQDFIRRHFVQGPTTIHYELWELNQLIQMAKKVFQAGPSLVEFCASVYICGDIHGQYTDLLRIFYTCGPPGKVRYLFLGDYVDRGRHSLEVIVLLLACKVWYPKQMILLRGNHEVKKINNTYGFKRELQQRYKDITEWSPLYKNFNDVFAEMPLAAVISNKILCMHGGLSPELNSLDDIRNIKRPIHILSRGIVQDLLWSDPEINIRGFQPNHVRLVSVLFGEDAVYEKLKQLDIQLIIRAHQVVEYGYAFFANQRLITVFSASRYYEDVCNWGAVVHVDDELECTFKIFKPIEYMDRKTLKPDDTIDEDDGGNIADIGGHQPSMPPPSLAQEAVAREKANPS